MMKIATVGIGDFYDLHPIVLGMGVGNQVSEIAGFDVYRRFEEPKRPPYELEFGEQFPEGRIDRRDKGRAGIPRGRQTRPVVAFAKIGG